MLGWLLLFEAGVHLIMMLLVLLLLRFFMLCWLVTAQRWRLQSTPTIPVMASQKSRIRRIRASEGHVVA